jgi:hypothetical protein
VMGGKLSAFSCQLSVKSIKHVNPGPCPKDLWQQQDLGKNHFVILSGAKDLDSSVAPLPQNDNFYCVSQKIMGSARHAGIVAAMGRPLLTCC